MFALQAGVLAVLVVGAVAGIPRPSSINTTETAPVANVIVKENALKISLPASITGLKLGLAHYEKRTRVFLDNMRREYFTMSTDRSRFLAELVEYMDSLPKNGTKIVTQKYRESCYCDSTMQSPCPERCMYSCKIGYYYYNDCSERSDQPCYCENSSTKMCDYGAISNCYNEKLVVVPEPSPCGNFSVDQSLITGSYSRFAHLLIEPLRVLVRRLEFQVKSLKQSVLAAEMVLNITVQLCDGQDTTCFPEAAELLSQKLSDLSQLQRNITFDMIQAQNKAESVEKDVEDLKEQTFNQINQSIREYVCCLKGLKFSVKDNDCAPKTVETAVQPLRPTHPIRWCQPPNFKCDNARCIPQNSVCDGADDCGDLSDELNC